MGAAETILSDFSGFKGNLKIEDPFLIIMDSKSKSFLCSLVGPPLCGVF